MGKTRRAPIKVLHLLPSSQPGGAQRHVLDLLRHLPKDLQQAVSAPDGPFLGAAHRAGATIFQNDLGHLGRWAWFTWLETDRSVVDFQPDVIHTHGKGAGLYGRLAAWRRGIPSVHTMHGWHPYGGWRRPLYVALERFLSRRTACLICLGESERAVVEQVGLKPARWRTIPNGVAPVMWQSEIIQGGLPHLSRLTVLTTARPDTVKRLDLLAEAVRIADGVLVNSPSPVQADVYASASEGEGCPYGMLDAMALGMPVVATLVRGHTDLVQHGFNGFLSAPDALEMAGFLMHLRDHPDTRRRMGLASMAIVHDRHSLEVMVRETAECYNEVVKTC